MRVRLGTLVLISLLLVAPSRAIGREDPVTRARTMHRAVFEHLDDPSLERRTEAVLRLEEAIDLDPDGRGGNHWWLLGYVKELGSRDAEAVRCYRRALKQSPNDLAIWLGLGRTYKRQFLRTLDPDALGRAIAVLDTATRCFPPSTEPWVALVPLLYEKPDLARASAAAERSLKGHPRLPACGIAAAMTAYRTGDIERADSLYRAWIPRLPADLRVMFEHPGRFVGKLARSVPTAIDLNEVADTLRMSPPTPADLLPDPDPTTPQNETQLEYWCRVAHAWLLFDDPIRPGLDERANTFMRYGPPAQVIYNPVDLSLVFHFDPNSREALDPTPPKEGQTQAQRSHVVDGPGDYHLDPNDHGEWDPGDNWNRSEFPLNAQLWLYPDLGMRILLHDRSLQGRWTVPAAREPLPGSAPDPAVLAKRHDLLAMRGGFAVFPTLAPPAQRLDVRQTLVAFEGADGPRLAAFVSAPAESLQARWLVTDRNGRTVARATQAMGRSLCGAGRSASELDVPLMPGRYTVVVTARDAHGRRGIARDSLVLPMPTNVLSMSALVPSCGEPATLVDRDAVRLDPIHDRVVRGTAPLAVYFEITHLAIGDDGVSRYTFDYAVERLAVDKHGRSSAAGVTTSWASREELFRGRLRRQFLTVPVARLVPGRYRLTVTVHDTLSGLSDVGTLEFVRP